MSEQPKVSRPARDREPVGPVRAGTPLHRLLELAAGGVARELSAAARRGAEPSDPAPPVGSAARPASHGRS
jgi:hypothetical protein